MKNIYIVRHGESVLNRMKLDYYNAHKASGRDGDALVHTFDIPYTDEAIPLTAAGWEQARQIGLYLRTKEIGLAVVSPHLRTRQTYEGITKDWVRKPELVLDHRIKEINVGVRHGLTTALFEQKYPGEVEKKKKDKYNYRPPHGESYADVYARIHPAAHVIVLAARQHNVLVVAHGTSIKMLRKALEGLTQEEVLALPERDEPRNCSITHYQVHNNPYGRMLELKEYNAIKYKEF